MGTIVNFFTDIFVRLSIGEMNGFELALLVLFSYLGFLLLKKVAKWILTALKVIYHFTKNILSAKEKCKKIQCVKCGRTLDRCICPQNKGRSSIGKLIDYKKSHRK